MLFQVVLSNANLAHKAAFLLKMRRIRVSFVTRDTFKVSRAKSHAVLAQRVVTPIIRELSHALVARLVLPPMAQRNRPVSLVRKASLVVRRPVLHVPSAILAFIPPAFAPCLARNVLLALFRMSPVLRSASSVNLASSRTSLAPPSVPHVLLAPVETRSV